MEYGSIGDTVFDDVNGNGVQDAGEPGLPGVSLNLKDATVNVVDTMITDADGFYIFFDLVPMTWWVGVDTTTLPVGLSYPTTPVAIMHSLQPLENYLAADFGFGRSPVSTPESGSTLAMLGLVAAGLMGVRRRRA
jgi:hypothetical protein